MRAYTIREMLNTKYIVCKSKNDRGNPGKWRDILAIGSSHIHDLISVDVETLKITHSSLGISDNHELTRVYSEVKEMIDKDPETIRILLNTDESPETFSIPVFFEKDGDILKTFCKELGWPNVTISGEIMYENVYFPDSISAARYSYGTEENRAWSIREWENRISETKEKLKKFEDILELEKARHEKLGRFLDDNRSVG